MRYIIREKLFSFGDDFWIEDDSGRRVYLVDGRAFTLFREKLVLKDADGNELGFLREKLVSLRKAYEIHRGGHHVATVSRHLFNFLRCRFTVDVPGPDDYEAQGSFLDHDYRFTRGDRTVATVSKKWLTVRDTYAVDIADGEDEVLILASAVVIDQICHDRDGDESGH
ncbi:MAG: LURP-one-related family protein [Verrucomicrobiota bacterium]